MQNKKLNIQREMLKKKSFTKVEIKHIILKSIIQDHNVAPLVRIKALKKNNKKARFYYISKQKNNICLKTGRYKGVYNNFNLTRHYLKFLGSNNNLQNIKIASW